MTHNLAIRARAKRIAVVRAKGHIIVSDNVHITDSYQIKYKSVMKQTLLDLAAESPDCLTWKRTMNSLLREWRTHNLFYDLHLFRSHTKDVDLDYPAKWYTEIAYFLLSPFYLHWC